ncbi:glycosyltransferase family 4 protein [Methylotuvimicrobium sp. KM2]|uniref:glycosyltransferase family 4 protein n=1 Tax=Methylotuvimicrobium sp. KM2 TaxID=3133976 RepID=UPI00310103E7
MNILAIANQLPMPDRASGHLRFFSILKCLAKHHNVTLAVYASSYQQEELGIEAYNAYKQNLEGLSIAVSSQWIEAVRQSQFDIIWFEFYFAAQNFIDLVRYYQPSAHVIVDSVDVHYNRLEAKAKLTQNKADFALAAQVKSEELSVYQKADVVIAVSINDKELLISNCPKTAVEIIPNIHEIPDLDERIPSNSIQLLFVGGFNHKPNVDAVLFFCNDVMPLLREHGDHIHLTIVGSSPPPEVLALSAADITVTGFVPSVAPYYRNADIVIAPLRYGGGMKGKVGEAFSFSRPVITTGFGAEGFAIEPNQHYLLANSPTEFVNAILELSQNPGLYQTIAKNAWNFIKDNYSETAAERTINTFIGNINTVEIKRLNLFKYLSIRIKILLDRHLLWRFKNNDAS